jgi:formamidopyrimidine-DNA glycosylase
MAAGGGRDTEKDLFGCSGGYRTVLSGKSKDCPCPLCGSIIVRESYLGGNIYYCPTCQK